MRTRTKEKAMVQHLSTAESAVADDTVNPDAGCDVRTDAR
jgi:hypothetical protein